MRWLDPVKTVYLFLSTLLLLLPITFFGLMGDREDEIYSSILPLL